MKKYNKSISLTFLLLKAFLAHAQIVNLTVKDRTKIYLIDAYVKEIDINKEKMRPEIAEGDVTNEKGEVIGGIETYTYVDNKTKKLICIVHNEAKETYSTESYYYKNDTLVYALISIPQKKLLVKESGEYYFINDKCYLFVSKGSYELIKKQAILLEAQRYFEWQLKQEEEWNELKKKHSNAKHH